MYRVWKVTTLWRSGPSVSYRLFSEREYIPAIEEDARERARSVDPHGDAYRGVKVEEELNPPAEWIKSELREASAARREWVERESWLQKRLGVELLPTGPRPTHGTNEHGECRHGKVPFLGDECGICAALESRALSKPTPITHQQARDSAQRFINRHFNHKNDPQPRISIPADPARDDDLLLMSYIDQEEKR